MSLEQKMALRRKSRSKYTHLLDDEQISRWHAHVARGSEITADVYLRRMGCFCCEHEMTSRDLLSMDDDQVITMLNDTITEMEFEDYAGSYIKSVLKSIKSWFSFNRRNIVYRFKIKNVNDAPTLVNERTPTTEEQRKILLVCSNRERVACILISHAGLRPKTLGNYRGTDGLRVNDLPELRIDNAGKKVEFEKIPTMIIVRGPRSKAKHQYFTFLSDEGCEYLKNYLEERICAGENITQDSPILVPKSYDKDFIYATKIGDIIRDVLRKAGFHWRPYVLRSYFDTQLMLAESKGLILRDYRQFFMGHKGDIENTSTVNRRSLPEHVVEDMRLAYKRSMKYLVSYNVHNSTEDVELVFKKQMLLMAGYGSEELDKINIEDIGDEDLQKMVREKLLGSMMNNGAKQKVVDIDDVQKHIEQGWEFVSMLGADKAVLKLPV